MENMMLPGGERERRGENQHKIYNKNISFPALLTRPRLAASSDHHLFRNHSKKQLSSLRFTLTYSSFSIPLGFASFFTFQEITTLGSTENEDHLISACLQGIL